MTPFTKFHICLFLCSQSKFHHPRKGAVEAPGKNCVQAHKQLHFEMLVLVIRVCSCCIYLLIYCSAWFNGSSFNISCLACLIQGRTTILTCRYFSDNELSSMLVDKSDQVLLLVATDLSQSKACEAEFDQDVILTTTETSNSLTFIAVHIFRWLIYWITVFQWFTSHN